MRNLTKTISDDALIALILWTSPWRREWGHFWAPVLIENKDRFVGLGTASNYVRRQRLPLWDVLVLCDLVFAVHGSFQPLLDIGYCGPLKNVGSKFPWDKPCDLIVHLNPKTHFYDFKGRVQALWRERHIAEHQGAILIDFDELRSVALVIDCLPCRDRKIPIDECDGAEHALGPSSIFIKNPVHAACEFSIWYLKYNALVLYSERENEG